MIKTSPAGVDWYDNNDSRVLLFPRVFISDVSPWLSGSINLFGW
jgi:hypothetical protein